ARPLEDLLRRRVVRLLQPPAFDAAAPDVLVDRPDLVLRLRNLNSVRDAVVDLLAPRPRLAPAARQQPPFPHWGDNIEIRRQRAHDILDSELVVTLTGTAMRIRR